jgi:hypothetical protein
MGACYGPGATFQDPVFGTLERERAAAMWRMLCERAQDLALTISDVAADDARGSARLEARYTFTATGRHVTNRIQASFEFAFGRISRHVDRFDLYAWARQALGLKGMLLGRRHALKRPPLAGAPAAVYTTAGEGSCHSIPRSQTGSGSASPSAGT